MSDHERELLFTRGPGTAPGASEEQAVSDFLYVALTVAVFAVLAAVIAGLEQM